MDGRKDHWLDNYVLTYLQENKNYKFGLKISRALSALRFVSHSKTKLTPFEAYLGREAKTALRNSTKKPPLKNLNWKNVINQKLSGLDKASGLSEVELNLDWDKRSDLVYAPENRKTPRVLDENNLIETDVDSKVKEVNPKAQELPKAREWLKRHKTSTTTVYQRTGKTDPNDPRRYKRLPLKIEKLTKHTVQKKKGSLLRRSGVSFRSAAEESRIEKGTNANTPGPSKPTEQKRQAEKSIGNQLEMKRAQTTSENRKTKKKRIVESSEDESDEEEESEWAVVGREGEAEKTAASGANEPSGTDNTKTPKTVGNKRKLSEEATRRSTRQLRGVDKMGGVMIHRIEYK